MEHELQWGRTLSDAVNMTPLLPEGQLIKEFEGFYLNFSWQLQTTRSECKSSFTSSNKESSASLNRADGETRSLFSSPALHSFLNPHFCFHSISVHVDGVHMQASGLLCLKQQRRSSDSCFSTNRPVTWYFLVCMCFNISFNLPHKIIQVLIRSKSLKEQH